MGAGGSGWERVREVEGFGGRLGEVMRDWEREEYMRDVNRK